MSIFLILWVLLSTPTQSTTSSATYVIGGDRPTKKPVTPKKAVILEITNNK